MDLSTDRHVSVWGRVVMLTHLDCTRHFLNAFWSPSSLLDAADLPWWNLGKPVRGSFERLMFLVQDCELLLTASILT